MMQLSYERATAEDLDEVCAVARSATAAMRAAGVEQWNERYPTREDFQSDIARNQLYVGRAGGHIAVHYALNQSCDADYQNGYWQTEGPFAVLPRLCVAPDFQHQGIGKQTLRHIEETLKPTPIRAIRLDVFSGNFAAVRLYWRAGYTQVGEVDWQMGRFYLMEKAL
ncbi:MAG: GNAT family N-acetyltransferase [Clostridiales bacterium]|nr:GNAT family N-acetyltransferase [Clostridiales bacterium]